MRSKRTLFLILLIGVLIISGGCRKKEDEPTPTKPALAPTAIATTVPKPVLPEGSETALPSPTVKPTATALPTPTLTSLGLAPLGDDTPLSPEIIGRSPGVGAEIPLDGFVELYFDQPMDEASTSAALQLLDADGTAVDGDISWPQPRILRFKPRRTLKPNSSYSAILAATAKSADGVPLLDGLTLTFNSIGDLTVSQVSPVPNVSEVAVDSAITVIFNRPVVPLLAAQDQASLPNPLQTTPAISGQGEWINTSVYLFRPDQPLIGRSRYTATVLAQVVNEISASGAVMAQDYNWAFTATAPTYRYLSLVNWVDSPQDYFPNLLADQPFQIYFEQPMDPASTEAAISMVPDSGAAASFVFDWDKSFTSVVFTPTQQFELGADYTLRLSDSARSAYGGQLYQELVWHATTVYPPAVRATDPGNGRTQSRFINEFRLDFASPMDGESLEGKVIFSPELSGDGEGRYDTWDWSLHFYGLAPSTRYTVQILPGMQDPYGNEISERQTLSFTTAPYSPMASFNFPGQLAMYRAGGSTAAWVNYHNVNQMRVNLYTLSLQQFASLLYSYNPSDYRPAAADQIWSQTKDVSADLNVNAYQRFDMLDAGGAPLAPGYYFLTLNSPQVPADSVNLQAQPILLANANVALKTTANEAMIWLTDINNGAPVADVPVVFYDQMFNELFRQRTDANGLVYRDDLTLEVGYQAFYYAVTEDPTGAHFGMAISGWNDGVRPEDFGIYTDFYMQPGEPTSYVYTDRPIYRPGQEVFIKGVVRLNDDLVYSLPKYQTVDVSIASFDETIFDQAVPLNKFGTFDISLALDNEAALGSYYISVIVDEKWIGSGTFNVAEYRKPTFLVNVEAAETDLLAGDTIDLNVDAQFFSGGSVVGGDVEYSVYASDYTFRPGGNLSRYSFKSESRDETYSDYYYFDYNPSTLVTSGSGQTGSDGRLTLRIPAELSDEDGSRTFSIEATVTDVAGNAVSGRTDVIVHRSTVYPGIRPDQYVGQAGQQMSFEIALVDWEADPVPNQPVDVEIVERRWYSVQEENEQGQTIWKTTVEEIPVLKDEKVTVDSQGRAQLSFTPPKGGVYRAYITARGRLGGEAVSSADVWVSGSEYVSWRRLNDHSFELVADADSYRPGDTAEILIASPFQGPAHALVTVERGHIKQYETILLNSNSTLYYLPITGEMAPNVFVSVMVMKGVDANNPVPDFKVGMTQFTVEREEQELSVVLTPDRTTAGPGDEVTYTIMVKDNAGQPVDAEVSLALVDLAALSLAEPNAPNILDYFYSNRWLSVNTALMLTRLMDALNLELEAQMKGGGGGGGDMGILTVREDFPDTAYWEGQVQTGPDGETTVTITLPDSLTTWRMDARAVTLDTKVGQSTSDIVTTLPLLVSPNTPRFFVAGDSAVVGTAVHNNSSQELEATVTLEAEGVTLDSPPTQLITIPAGQQALVEWSLRVNDVGRVDFVFSASSGPYADASRPSLGTLEGQGIPVYKYQVPETVGTAGQLLEGGAVVESIGLPIFPGYELTEGELTVKIAPSLAAAMTGGLDYLAHYPYECTEQIVSRFLPNVLTTRALKAAGLSDPELEANLEEQVNIALQRLYNRQRADGGWPWWDGPETDTLVTAYVVQALLEARYSGYLISDGVLQQGISYLEDHLSEVDGLSGRFKDNRQAFLLYVLAKADRMPTGEISQLYARRASLDLYAQGYLAQAIRLIDSGDPRLDTLASDFISAAALSASGASWEEAERDYWNWNSDTRTTAIILDTLIKIDPQNPIVANGVRWLMAHRTDGRWASTQETAWTLMSLTDWMVISGELEADYQYEVALNGQLRGSGAANGDTLRDSWQMKVEVTDLFTDRLNRLAIGRSEGPGNLYYTTHLELSLPVSEVQALDQGVIISRAYYDPDNRQTPVTEMAQGDTFLARLTLVLAKSRHNLIIEDFLPAGLEAVDTSLKTSQQLGAPERYDRDEIFNQGMGWWYFDHVELRDEKVVISADYLPAGTYEYVYLVRASTPGEFQVIPPTAQEFYFPEVYGRGDGSLFVVKPRED